MNGNILRVPAMPVKVLYYGDLCGKHFHKKYTTFARVLFDIFGKNQISHLNDF